MLGQLWILRFVAYPPEFSSLIGSHAHLLTVGPALPEDYCFRQHLALCRHRIIDTRGKEHLVLGVGDSFRDNGGGRAGITGFYIDITEQFNKDVQQRLSEAVETISERLRN